MKSKQDRSGPWWLLLGLVVLLAAVPALAQSGDGYDLTWSSVDGGGARSQGGGYTLDGSAGQPDAGLLAGGDYILAGGFWAGGGQVIYRIYLPLLLRNQ